MTSPTHRLHRRTLVAVAAGGMVGASARAGVAAVLPSIGEGVPVDTLVENVVGSLLLGIVLVTIASRGRVGLAHPFLAVGALGSFTTFSAVAVESVLLARDGDVLVATSYWTATVVAGLLAALAGVVIGRALVGRIGRAR